MEEEYHPTELFSELHMHAPVQEPCPSHSAHTGLLGKKMQKEGLDFGCLSLARVRVETGSLQ